MLQKRLFAILSVLLGMAVSFGAFAQKQTVTGTVLDSTGPVIGAVLQGKDANAVTDMDGKFAITVSPQDVLTVSCLGYISKQVPVAGRTNLTITLEEDAFMMEDAVVVARRGTADDDLSDGIIICDLHFRSIRTGFFRNFFYLIYISFY